MIALASFGQNIDENGRIQSQKLALKTPSLPNVFLSEMKDDISTTSFKINYSLPEVKSMGEIKFFNPNKDEELKSIKLTESKGTITVSKSGFSVKAVVIGLYVDGLLLETSRVKF